MLLLWFNDRGLRLDYFELWLGERLLKEGGGWLYIERVTSFLNDVGVA